MTQRNDIRRHCGLAGLACLTILLSTAVTAMGQVGSSGSVEGTITDPSGASIPQATVKAVNVATGVETERKTTAAGFYVLSPLPAGEYTVTVTASGFQTLTQARVVVDALATVALSLQLKIGSGTQQVTVEESPTMLHTDDATLGQTMENNVYTFAPTRDEWCSAGSHPVRRTGCRGLRDDHPSGRAHHGIVQRDPRR
jgi:hypothetical protein